MVERNEEPIARHLPLRASPGAFERWVVADDESELLAAIRQARSEKLAVRVLPPFSDILPPEGGCSGVCLRLGSEFERLESVDEKHVVCGTMVPLARLGLVRGFELLLEAGGTVYDALVEGWLRPAVEKVRFFRGRSFDEAPAYDPELKGLPVRVWLVAHTKLQPVRAGTAFSEIGRRGLDLRTLLARTGVSAVRLRDAALAPDDAAVAVNRGDATAKEIQLLLAAVADKVKTATGIELTNRLVPLGRGGRW